MCYLFCPTLHPGADSPLGSPTLCAEFGRKPDLTEASEAHPIMYGRFVRYVAVRELVRRSSLAIGQSPVVWD